MSDYVVYDIETFSDNYSESVTIADCNRISVIVTHDSTNGFKVWLENEVAEAVEFMLSFQKIVGFNIKGYDSTIIDRYLPGSAKRLNERSFDILELIESRAGRRLSLDSIVNATLKKHKAGSGSDAILWWHQRRKDLVIEYCKSDVQITDELYRHIIDFGFLNYEYLGNKTRLELGKNQEVPTKSSTFRLTQSDGPDIDLDPENKEFFKAFDLIKNTNDNLYLTGKAGTGKTTFLKYLVKNLPKKSAVVAFTGVAAVNAGGQTIHSFFKIDPGQPPFLPNDVRLRIRPSPGDADKTTIFSHFQYNKVRLDTIRALDVLIIDEISMVRADMVDVIDKLLRAFSRKDRRLPFGGVQVIMIGDVFQLPPVQKNDWTQVLSKFYKSPFFFDSHVLQNDSGPLPYIELKKIYRQKEAQFIDLLNRVRINEPLNSDLIALQTRVKPFNSSMFDENYVALCSTNQPANQINAMQLERLDGISHTLTGTISGEFPDGSLPTEKDLRLRVGAQVMFIRNTKQFFNGKIGKIESIDDGKVTASLVNNLGERHTILLEQYTWKNVRYKVDKDLNRIEQEVMGTFTQYPIKLAWAITVHKSQGLTFEKVLININNFTPSGLVYVALSRCTSFDTLVLRHPIERGQIQADPRVVEFAKSETPDTLIIERIRNGTADDRYRQSRREFKKRNYETATTYFIDGASYKKVIGTEAYERLIPHYRSEILQNAKTIVRIIKKQLKGRPKLQAELVQEVRKLTTRPKG